MRLREVLSFNNYPSSRLNEKITKSLLKGNYKSIGKVKTNSSADQSDMKEITLNKFLAQPPVGFQKNTKPPTYELIENSEHFQFWTVFEIFSQVFHNCFSPTTRNFMHVALNCCSTDKINNKQRCSTTMNSKKDLICIRIGYGLYGIHKIEIK